MKTKPSLDSPSGLAVSSRPRRFGPCLYLLATAFGTFASAQTLTSWNGNSNTNWNNGGNWGNGTPDAPADNIPARFGITFNNQPKVTAGSGFQYAEMLRVDTPNKDVTITIDSGPQLALDTWLNAGLNYGIDMRSAGRNLTITGPGVFIQRDDKITSGPALWAVNSGGANGDFSIESGIDFRIDPGVELNIDVGAGRTVNIAASIATTTASVTKTGAGDLFLLGAHAYSGKTAINGGVLTINNIAGVGSLPASTVADQITFDGGTLAATATTNFTFAQGIRRGISLLAGGGTLAPAAGFQIAYDGIIDGVGSLTLDGPGTFLIRGVSNDYDGGTFVKQGTLKLGRPGGGFDSRLPTDTVLTLGDGANGGVLNLNGINQILGGLVTSGTAGAANQVISPSERTLTVDSDVDNTFAGRLGGGASNNNVVLVKQGTGIWTLSGANTYTGSTTISAGAIDTTTASSGAGSYTVADSASLGVSIAALGQTLNVSDLTMGNSDLDITLDPTTPTAPIVANAGALTLNGVMTVNVIGTPSVTDQDIVLLSYDSLAGVGSIVSGILPSFPGFTTNFVHDMGAKEVRLSYTSSQGPVTADSVFPAALTTVYGSASGSTSVAISGASLAEDIIATAPGGFEVSNDDSAFGTTAVFAQTAGSASGTLYIRLAADSPVLGSYDSASVTLTSLGAYPLTVSTAASGNAVTPKELTIPDAMANNKVFDGTTDATLTGSLQAAQAPGTGSSSDGIPYTGDDLSLEIPGGTFASAAPGTAIAVTPDAFTLSGADVDNYTLAQPTGLTADITALDDIYWDGTGNNNGWGTTSRWSTDSGAATPDPASVPNITSTAVFNTTVENTNQVATLNGNRSAGGLVFNSTGTVLIKGDTNDNTDYDLPIGAGGITVNSGAGAVTLGTSGSQVRPVLSAPQTWALATGTTMTVVNAISGSYDLNKSGDGDLVLTGANSYTGNTIVGNGNLVLADGGAFGDGNIILGDGVNSGNLVISQSTALNPGPEGKVISGTGTLVKNGSGAVSFEGAANTFEGPTQIFEGMVTITGDDGLGAVPASVDPDAILLDGGTLNTRMVGGLGGSFTINANRGITLGVGGGTILNSTPSGSFTATYDGVITGVGSLTKTGGQTLRLGGDHDFTGGIVVTNGNTYLSGNNSFTGGVSITAGTLRLENGGALNAVAPNAVNLTGGNLVLTGNSITISGLSGTGGNVQNLDAAAAALTVDQDSDSAYDGNLIDGAASGALSLVKDGTGTLILNGTSTYTGSTQVNEGALGGTGSVTSNVTLAATGGLAPGASAGTFTITGDLDISASTSGDGLMEFELDALASASDQIVVNGTTTIGTNLLGFSDFSFTDLGGLEVGTYVLITSTTLTGSLDPGDLTGSIGSFTGTLQRNGEDLELLVAGGDSFEGWIEAASGFANPSLLASPADKLPGADPDNDGIDNFGEFAFDGDPTDSGNNGKVLLVVADGDDGMDTDDELILTVAVRVGASEAFTGATSKAANRDGIDYAIEGSLSLATFDEVVTVQSAPVAPAGGLPALSSPEWEWISFSLDGSNGLPDKGFLRARADAEGPPL